MSRSLPMTAAWFLPLVICALDAPWLRETPAAVRKTFVNSTGIRMISVKGKRFDAWTPSAKQFYLPLKNGKRPTAAFALNRPRVTAPVTLKDYWLSEFPVTNRLYRQFVKATGHREPGGRLVNFYWRPSNGGTWNREKFQADQVPVTGVNNTDIEAFCKWLSTRDGRRYRPPTIREFEFANRAGTSTRFWWGPQPDVRKMNFGLSMIGHPTPVGSYPPNPWGFYDMHGNVWQFCTDAGRYSAMGSAFNCPRRWTGIDAWGNFYEGPNTMSLLSTGFRVACDADQGTSRPGDLKKPAPMTQALLVRDASRPHVWDGACQEDEDRQLIMDVMMEILNIDMKQLDSRQALERVAEDELCTTSLPWSNDAKETLGDLGALLYTYRRSLQAKTEWVGGVPDASADDHSLRMLFADQAGLQETQLTIRHKEGQHRNWALVSFFSEKDAVSAQNTVIEAEGDDGKPVALMVRECKVEQQLLERGSALSSGGGQLHSISASHMRSDGREGKRNDVDNDALTVMTA